ncbi:MAG: acyl CoA:acetate/3-ketoacid CoA transferase [Actinobacteria bacterium]|nr:acyl CoA:acetate/3-ketoacid CoA transferase [Actinomycetota bacterium]
MSKVLEVKDAVKKIKDGSTIAIGGFVGIGHPEEITAAIELAFLECRKPCNLTVVYAAGQGDGKNRGINHLAHEGLVKRVIGGHWGLAPKMVKLAVENKIEAYNFPQGVITHLYRDIAAKKPGTLTHVGISTFVDPRLSGGRINNKTVEDMVSLIEIDGKEWLHYRAFPVDVALIRGTSADPDGNISMERECGPLEMLAIAQAASNSGGIVIVQVERLVQKNTLNPWMVKIPGILVDYIVVARKQNHWQTFSCEYDPSLSGEVRVPNDFIPGMPLDERKVICSRAFKEIKENDVVNLGIGLPEGISIVANEKGMFSKMNLTVEAGTNGGIPAGGLSFGASFNPACIINQPSQFDFYDGGGLDIAFLGMAQADRHGNVNVSRFGSRLAGCGGFINITQNTRKVVFCGTLTSGGLEIKIENKKMKILKEGVHKKFLKDVEQITFSGDYAREKKHEVLYVTERCVFKLGQKTIMLTEIAPGIDIKSDILAHIDFLPLISEKLKIMDEDIFSQA